MGGDELFDSSDAEKEIERLNLRSKLVTWITPTNQEIELIIPPTVYPPREDTELIAKRISSLGPGNNRNFLEIGSGSGALSIFAASLGWKVYACDVNPYAVVATSGNASKNGYEIVVKEGGIGPESFPFGKQKFDLIVWNLPYIENQNFDEVLGPMEEAALIDSDMLGLGTRALNSIVSNELLACNGRVLLLSRKNGVKNTTNLSEREWDELAFPDGETLAIYCYWKPYENCENISLEITDSTNEQIKEKSGVGSHISAKHQTHGKGRRSREWISIDSSYAGSWIVYEGNDFSPGIIQLVGGLAVVNAIDSNKLSIKWPNDIYIGKRKLAGVLVEGYSINNFSRVVLGIGVNLAREGNVPREFACVDELKHYSFEDFDAKLTKEIASLLEEKPDLPPINKHTILNSVHSLIARFGKPIYNDQIFEAFELNSSGELVLSDTIIDDGEEIDWV